MNAIRTVLVALAAIGMVIGIVVGTEADGTCGEGVDSANGVGVYATGKGL